MAARRNKTQARRNSGNGTPGWVWLIAGLVLGAAAFFIVPGLIKKDGDGFFRPQPNPDAQPARVADADGTADEVAAETSTATSQPDAQAAGDSATKPTQYDFYTLLPGKEVQMSDAEIAASAREESASAARAQKAAAAAAAASNPGDPTPVTETPVAAVPSAASTSATTTPTTTAATTTAATPASASAAPAGDARYILQAGAFGASGDAESTKAKIALLGLSARVESAQIGAKTVYRVRMGPYGSASELAEAKQKLASGGLPAMAIKAR
ncbi:MAG: SPOR domain-containing protein [Pseudoxanthomonas sp.]